MLDTAGNIYRRAVVRLVELSARFARWVVGGTALLTVVFFYYALTHISLDTDPSEMLDPKLQFRKLEKDLDKAFPQFSDVIVVMIEGENSSRADAASQNLIARLNLEKATLE